MVAEESVGVYPPCHNSWFKILRWLGLCPVDHPYEDFDRVIVVNIVSPTARSSHIPTTILQHLGSSPRTLTLTETTSTTSSVTLVPATIYEHTTETITHYRTLYGTYNAFFDGLLQTKHSMTTSTALVTVTQTFTPPPFIMKVTRTLTPPTAFVTITHSPALSITTAGPAMGWASTTTNLWDNHKPLLATEGPGSATLAALVMCCSLFSILYWLMLCHRRSRRRSVSQFEIDISSKSSHSLNSALASRAEKVVEQVKRNVSFWGTKCPISEDDVSRNRGIKDDCQQDLANFTMSNIEDLLMSSIDPDTRLREIEGTVYTRQLSIWQLQQGCWQPTYDESIGGYTIPAIPAPPSWNTGHQPLLTTLDDDSILQAYQREVEKYIRLYIEVLGCIERCVKYKNLSRDSKVFFGAVKDEVLDICAAGFNQLHYKPYRGKESMLFLKQEKNILLRVRHRLQAIEAIHRYEHERPEQDKKLIVELRTALEAMEKSMEEVNLRPEIDHDRFEAAPKSYLPWFFIFHIPHLFRKQGKQRVSITENDVITRSSSETVAESDDGTDPCVGSVYRSGKMGMLYGLVSRKRINTRPAVSKSIDFTETQAQSSTNESEAVLLSPPKEWDGIKMVRPLQSTNSQHQDSVSKFKHELSPKDGLDLPATPDDVPMVRKETKETGHRRASGQRAWTIHSQFWKDPWQVESETEIYSEIAYPSVISDQDHEVAERTVLRDIPAPSTHHVYEIEASQQQSSMSSARPESQPGYQTYRDPRSPVSDSSSDGRSSGPERNIVNFESPSAKTDSEVNALSERLQGSNLTMDKEDHLNEARLSDSDGKIIEEPEKWYDRVTNEQLLAPAPRDDFPSAAILDVNMEEDAPFPDSLMDEMMDVSELSGNPHIYLQDLDQDLQDAPVEETPVPNDVELNEEYREPEGVPVQGSTEGTIAPNDVTMDEEFPEVEQEPVQEPELGPMVEMVDEGLATRSPPSEDMVDSPRFGAIPELLLGSGLGDDLNSGGLLSGSNSDVTTSQIYFEGDFLETSNITPAVPNTSEMTQAPVTDSLPMPLTAENVLRASSMQQDPVVATGPESELSRLSDFAGIADRVNLFHMIETALIQPYELGGPPRAERRPDFGALEECFRGFFENRAESWDDGFSTMTMWTRMDLHGHLMEWVQRFCSLDNPRGWDELLSQAIRRGLKMTQSTESLEKEGILDRPWRRESPPLNVVGNEAQGGISAGQQVTAAPEQQIKPYSTENETLEQANQKLLREILIVLTQWSPTPRGKVNDHTVHHDPEYADLRQYIFNLSEWRKTNQPQRSTIRDEVFNYIRALPNTKGHRNLKNFTAIKAALDRGLRMDDAPPPSVPSASTPSSEASEPANDYYIDDDGTGSATGWESPKQQKGGISSDEHEDSSENSDEVPDDRLSVEARAARERKRTDQELINTILAEIPEERVDDDDGDPGPSYSR